MNNYITPDLRCAFNEGYEEARRKFAEELNKMEEEIEKLEFYDFDCHLVLPACEVYDIIDNHISELKGGAE